MSPKKTMMINATDPEEIRVAALFDGVLFDYDVEFLHNEKIKGNLYKARVVRVDTSLQAAFVHFGVEGGPVAWVPFGVLGDGDLAEAQGQSPPAERLDRVLTIDAESRVHVIVSHNVVAIDIHNPDLTRIGGRGSIG